MSRNVSGPMPPMVTSQSLRNPHFCGEDRPVGVNIASSRHPSDSRNFDPFISDIMPRSSRLSLFKSDRDCSHRPQATPNSSRPLSHLSNDFPDFLFPALHLCTLNTSSWPHHASSRVLQRRNAASLRWSEDVAETNHIPDTAVLHACSGLQPTCRLPRSKVSRAWGSFPRLRDSSIQDFSTAGSRPRTLRRCAPPFSSCRLRNRDAGPPSQPRKFRVPQDGLRQAQCLSMYCHPARLDSGTAS